MANEIDMTELSQRCDELIRGYDKLIDDIDTTLNPTKTRRTLTLVKRLQGTGANLKQPNLYDTTGDVTT